MKNLSQDLEIIKKGTLEIISEDQLKSRLSESKPLRIKWGADPSAPDLHLGHLVILKKLKAFQNLGHEVIFLIGDFTALIGDPTGRSETRKPLTENDVKKNAETYKDQIFKILDPKKTQIVFNSAWLNQMSLKNVVRLTSQYTVARLLERADFKERFQKHCDITLVEFIYPLLQGYDSVELKADVEIGGSDQKFNLLVGRALQKSYGLKPQVILTMPILEGLDGVQKMSKSLGNYVGITEPAAEIYGKIMSLPDKLMPKYYELLTDLEFDSKKHPKDAKKLLALTITQTFWGESLAKKAEIQFEETFSRRKTPQELRVVKLPKNTKITAAIKEAGFSSSTGEASRLIKQGAVELNQQKILSLDFCFEDAGEFVLKVGKRKFSKIIIK